MHNNLIVGEKISFLRIESLWPVDLAGSHRAIAVKGKSLMRWRLGVA
jgi:hypothetical protein